MAERMVQWPDLADFGAKIGIAQDGDRKVLVLEVVDRPRFVAAISPQVVAAAARIGFAIDERLVGQYVSAGTRFKEDDLQAMFPGFQGDRHIVAQPVSQVLVSLAQPAAGFVEPEPVQPWMITLAEWSALPSNTVVDGVPMFDCRDHRGKEYRLPMGNFGEYHGYFVAQALVDKVPVPEKVLADYPAEVFGWLGREWTGGNGQARKVVGLMKIQGQYKLEVAEGGKPAMSAGNEFHSPADIEQMIKVDSSWNEHRIEIERQAAEKAAAEAARKADDVNGFLAGMNAMQSGRIKVALDKQFRFDDGTVMTRRERVEHLAATGALVVETIEEDRIKPMGRRRFNNATEGEQRAHEERVKNAGKKTVYLVGGSDLGKVAYDYAQHLLAQQPAERQAAEPAKEAVVALELPAGQDWTERAREIVTTLLTMRPADEVALIGSDVSKAEERKLLVELGEQVMPEAQKSDQEKVGVFACAFATGQIPLEEWSRHKQYFAAGAKRLAVVHTLPLVKQFLSQGQLSAMGDALRGDDKGFFQDKFLELAKVISEMPQTYETDGSGFRAIVHLHYFRGNSHWYITEKDSDPPDEDGIRQGQVQAFGYAILNGDLYNAEVGYISIKELIENGCELDLHWEPKPLNAVNDELGRRYSGIKESDESSDDEPWLLSVEAVRSMSIAQFRAIYEELEKENYHLENILLLAKRHGSMVEIADAETIMRIRDEGNGIDFDVSDWSHALRRFLTSQGSKDALERTKVQALITSEYGYAKILSEGNGDPKKSQLALSNPDRLDAFFQIRIVAVRNALRELGWEGPNNGQLSKDGRKLEMELDQTAGSMNVLGMTFNGIRDDLTKNPVEFARAVDEKHRLEQQQSDGVSVFATRQTNAANSFMNAVIEQFNMNEEEANDALAHLMAEEIVTLDTVMGQFKLKDGRFWDQKVMRRAAGIKSGRLVGGLDPDSLLFRDLQAAFDLRQFRWVKDKQEGIWFGQFTGHDGAVMRYGEVRDMNAGEIRVSHLERYRTSDGTGFEAYRPALEHEGKHVEMRLRQDGFFVKPDEPESTANKKAADTPTQSERSVAADSEKIVDVGEKIGGARKDLAGRRLQVGDLADMNELEVRELVTKNAVFPPWNYRQMRDDGYEPAAAIYLKLLRDKLPVDHEKEPVPAEISFKEDNWGGGGLISYHLAVPNPEVYIRSLDYLFTRLDGVKTVAALKESLSEIYGRIRRAKKIVYEHYRQRSRPSDDEMGIIRDGFFFKESIGSKAERVLSNYERYLRNATYDAEQNGWNGLIKSRGAKETRDENDKIPERPHLRNIVRVGEDTRGGKDMAAEEMMNSLGCRGVEFGEWLPQDERQTVINHGYDALCDMADVLGVEPSDIGLDGTLALAFGSRGRGGRRAALAHYETARKVTNLTRMNGAGSLAHEYGHALDNFFGERLTGRAGDWISELPHLRADTDGEEGEALRKVFGAYMEVMKAIKERGKTSGEVKADCRAKIELWSGYARGWAGAVARDAFGYRNDQSEKCDKFVEQAMDLLRQMVNGEMVSNARLEGRNCSNDEHYHVHLHDLLLDLGATGKVAKKHMDGLMGNIAAVANVVSKLNDIELYPDDSICESRGKSHYLENAERLDRKRSKAYWSNSIELFARAFECYAFDTLQKLGRQSDYLVHGVEEGRFGGDGFRGDPYPSGVEREQINGEIARLTQAVAAYIHLLNQRDVPQVIEAPAG